MIHVYYGNGKGKTTAAVGLAVRAAGRGIPVLFSQFMKDGTSGEVKVLEGIEGISVQAPKSFYGFFSKMNDGQKSEMTLEYEAELASVRQFAKENSRGCLVVLDEVLHAVKYGLVSEDALCDFLSGISDGTEVVLTGAEPSERIRNLADYVTMMKKDKHPFDLGVMAREGVEY